MILVVGATGQLGTAITRKLVAAQQPVRAFVRRSSDYRHLQALGVDLAFGDLREPATVQAACQGVTTIITTANGVIQRKGDNIKTIDGEGNANLNQALLGPLGDGPANIMGMIRMTGASDSAYPTTDAKRLLERPMTTMQEFLAQKVSIPT